MTDSASATGQLPLPFPMTGPVIPFIEGDANSEALALVRRWATAVNAGERLPPLAIMGPEGAGKSRLLHFAAREVGAAVSVPPITDRTAETDAPAIAIDDADRAGTLELFSLYNICIAHEKPLLLAGSSRLSAWGEGDAAARPDLQSRLSTAMTATLEAPDQRMMTSALRGGLSGAGLRLKDADIAAVAEGLVRRFSAVEAIVTTASKRAQEGGLGGKALLQTAMRDNPQHCL